VIAAVEFKQLLLCHVQDSRLDVFETGIAGWGDDALCPWIAYLIEIEDAPKVGHLYRQYPLLEDIPCILLRLAAETKVTR